MAVRIVQLLNPSVSPLNTQLKWSEFSQDNLLSNLVNQQKISESLIEEIADDLAEFHKSAPICPKQEKFAEPDEVLKPVKQNFDQCRTMLTDQKKLSQLDTLEAWALAQHKKYESVFQHRKDSGKIKECHGDIHLGNIILIDNHPVIFDCIEFNTEFRWLDIMADFGFLAMDLQSHNLKALSFLLVNRYFQRTGNYDDLKVLKYYQAYRAMVRAKITLFQLQDPNLSAQAKAQCEKTYDRCIQLADSYKTEETPELIITYGAVWLWKIFIKPLLGQQIKRHSYFL